MVHGDNYLQVGQYLKVGEYLVSKNNLFFAIMQVNGTLGIYRGTYPDNNHGGVWSSSKSLPDANYITYLHNNGNLCIYKNRDPSDIENDNKGVVWCTNAVDPIDEIKVEEIYYHLENTKISNPILKEIGAAIIKNETGTPKESSFILQKTLEESSSWSSTVNVNVTVTENINIGIPEICEAGVEISVEVGVSFTYGQTTTRSQSLSHEVKLSADPYTEVTCLSIIKDSVITVPCTFKGKATLKSGTILHIEFDGIYRGTTAYNIEDTYSEHKLDGSQHKISFTENKIGVINLIH